MKVMEKYMPTKEGEGIVSTLEGNAYNTSENIILRIFGAIERILSIITGSPKKITVIVTNRRVVTIETQKIFWFIDSSVSARTYTPRSIVQAGYSLRRDFLIFKSHYLDFVSSGSSYLIKARDGQGKVLEVINHMTDLADKVSGK